MNNHIINICYRNNYVGLSLDADVIATILEREGFTVYYNGHPIKFNGISKVRKIYPKLLKAGLTALSHIGIKRIAVNIHLEIIEENDIGLAEKNILIANLEWLREASYALLSEMDLFICKTKSAQHFFEEKGLPSIYTSFSTISPYDNQYKQKPNTFVHIAGSSVVKGTVPLAQLWSKHPEWPKLTILAKSVKHLKQFEAANLDLIGGFLERADLKIIQNESEIYLCPSEAEGFGHTICEALSCGAIVITVDGYPMNELVQPERGLLVKVAYSEPMYHARKFIFDPADFERKIEALLKMTKAEKDQMKFNAQKWFIDNDSFFQKTLTSAVKDVFEE